MAHKALIFTQKIKFFEIAENEGGKSATSLFSDSYMPLLFILHAYTMLIKYPNPGVNAGPVFQNIITCYLLVPSKYLRNTTILKI